MFESRVFHQHLSTTKRNRESNYRFPEKAADQHVEKAPDGQSEASLLSESSHFGMNVCMI